MTRGGAALLAGVALALVVAGGVAPGSAQAAVEPAHVAIVVVRGVSYEDLSSVPAVRELAAREGTRRFPSGAALLVPQEPVDSQLDRIRQLVAARGEPYRVRITEVRGPIERARAPLTGMLDESLLPGGLVVVVGADPSEEMVRAKDDVLPLYLGPADVPSLGEAGALTSDATRRVGVVSSLDLVPTVLAAAGIPSWDGEEGERIGSTDAPAPDALYERYLQMRRLTVPVQTAAWLYALVAGLALGTLAAMRARDPGRVSDALVGRARWVALSVVPLTVSMLAAGHLPSLTYAVVIPFLVAGTVAGTVALVPFASGGRLAPLWALGAVVLLLVSIETVLGWTAALTPLLGGSQLDGGRFFGMPNVASGIVIGSGVYLVTRWWRSGPGPTALVAVAVIALVALPWTGANLGAGVAASAAAGLWFVQERRGGLDLRAASIAAGVTAVGAVAILAIYRLAPGAPSHGARFARGELGGPIEVALERLRVGFDLLVSSPAALIPVVGIMVLALIGFRPSRAVAPAFVAEPALRALVATIALSGIVAYLVEDSGAGASGMFFALGVAALFHVSLPLAGGQDRAIR